MPVLLTGRPIVIDPGGSTQPLLERQLLLYIVLHVGCINSHSRVVAAETDVGRRKEVVDGRRAKAPRLPRMAKGGSAL